jgi:hypothetical protein
MALLRCDICGGSKQVTLPIRFASITMDQSDPTALEENSRQFDCPQCVKTVPYRRVRALRCVTKVAYEQFGKYQNPVERGLAEKFGAYLMKEGLIKFGASNLDDFTQTMVQVSAEIAVVTQANAKIAGAQVLEAEADAPEIPANVLYRRKRAEVEITPGYDLPEPWEPRVFGTPKTKKEKIEEIRNVRAGITSRFSGLDLGEFNGEDE